MDTAVVFDLATYPPIRTKGEKNMAFTEEEKKELIKLIREANAKRPTKEEIMAVKDTATRQKLISENLDLFVDSQE